MHFQIKVYYSDKTKQALLGVPKSVSSNFKRGDKFNAQIIDDNTIILKKAMEEKRQ